jgi:hypothetical protein
MIFRHLTCTTTIRHSLIATLHLVALPPALWSIATFRQCACNPAGVRSYVRY